MKREDQRRERTRLLVIWSIAAIALAGIVIAVTIPIVQRSRQQTDTDQAVQTFDGLSRNHVETPASYPQAPPAGGDHSPVWLNCAAYTAAVPEMNVVHSLEHGAVWITYRTGLPAEAVKALQRLADQPYVVVSPSAGLSAPVIATAWGKQLKADSPGDPRLDSFIASYRQGPQTPEPGAACSGGTDAGIPQANA